LHLLVDEQVLRLEVAVEDVLRVYIHVCMYVDIIYSRVRSAASVYACMYVCIYYMYIVSISISISLHLIVDEQVLRLEVAVEDVLRVAVGEHADSLHHHEANLKEERRDRMVKPEVSLIR